ncbi:unnamed protein product [Cunninghamella echinulata]
MKLIGFKFLLASLFVTLFISKAECSVSPVSLLSSAYKLYQWFETVSDTWKYKLTDKHSSEWNNNKIIWFTADKTLGEPNVVYYFVIPYRDNTPKEQQADQKMVEYEINKGDNSDMTAQKVLENLEDLATVNNWYVKVYHNNYGEPYEHLTGDGQYIVISPPEYFITIGPYENYVNEAVTDQQMKDRANWYCEEANKLKRSNGQLENECNH